MKYGEARVTVSCIKYHITFYHYIIIVIEGFTITFLNNKAISRITTVKVSLLKKMSDGRAYD